MTSGRVGHNGRELPSRAPRREEIATHTVGVILEGGPTKADLLVVDVGGGAMVVKDFAAKSRWARLLGRVQVGREFRAYEWLGPNRGVPALIGRVDAHALAIEKIEGEQLALTSSQRNDGERLVARLRLLIDRLHSKGLVHLDLRGRENLLILPDGDLVIVDLAGAFWFRPGGLAHRLFFHLFSIADRAAILKWKEMLAPGHFTPEEEAFMRRFRILRAFWIFNRKRPQR